MSLEDEEIAWLFNNTVDYNPDEDGKYDYYGNPIDINGIYYKIGVEPDIVDVFDLEYYCIHELGLKIPQFTFDNHPDCGDTTICIMALENAGYSVQSLDMDIDWDWIN